MIEKKIAIITLHDINPSCAEKLQLITDELNKLKLKYNLSVVHIMTRNITLKIIWLFALKLHHYYS